MKRALSIFLVLGSCSVVLWTFIAFTNPREASLYFMNVGQGDATLFESKNGFRALIDTGKDSSIISQLDAILPIHDRSIDILFISHPDSDHFGGALAVLARYRVRLVVCNGDYDAKDSWDAFMAKIQKEKIPVFVARAGDIITAGETKISAVWPTAAYMQSHDNNESSLGLVLESEGVKTLFPGDITMHEENLIASTGLDVDVLHLAHHGSHYATGDNFLQTLTPLYAIIQVGKNTYGHPSAEVLDRLEQNNIPYFRNDVNGTIRAALQNGTVSIFTQK